MYPVRLTGERVGLREFDRRDGPAIHRYAADPEVVRYMFWGPNNPAETEQFLKQKLASARAAPRGEYELALVLRDTGELVGGAGLRLDPGPHRRGNLGYVLRRDQWGRGLGTEAAALLLHLGFGRLGLHRMWATCDADNAASRRVLEKVGMRCEGRMRQDTLIRGCWRDSLLYAVLEDEWREARCEATRPEGR